jgi:hypothetical protein
MAIAFANLGTSAAPDFASQTPATSFSTASWTPPTSGLILLSIYAVKVGGSEIPTVSGNSLTWVQIATHLNGNWRLSLFAANASGSTTGATTVSFGGNSQLRCLASFAQATGIDLSGGAAATFVQTVAETDAATTTPSITLAAASNAANRPYVAFSNGGIVDIGNRPVTPRTNWTELDEMFVTDGGILETQFRSNAFETTASASVTGATTWEGIAVELKVEPESVAHTKTVTDAVGAIDSVPQTQTAKQTFSEGLGSSDSTTPTAQYRPAFADALGLVDSRTWVAPSHRTFTESLGLVDASTAGFLHQRTLTDSLGIADGEVASYSDARFTYADSQINYQGEIEQEVFLTLAHPHTDALGVTDAISVIHLVGGIQQTVTDALGLTDAVTVAASYKQVQTDALGLTDSASTVSQLALVLTDALGLSDAVSHKLAKALTDSLGLSDSATRTGAGFASRTDVLGLTDSIDVSLVTGTGVIQSFTELLGITDQVTQAAMFHVTVTDALGVTDSAARTVTLRAVLFEVLGLTDTAQAARILYFTLTDPEGLLDSLLVIAGGEPVPMDFEGIHDSTLALTGKHTPTKVLEGKHTPDADLVGSSGLTS